MNHPTLFLRLCLAGIAFSAMAPFVGAQRPNLPQCGPDYRNVTCFGARGSDQLDDTVAIQAAVDSLDATTGGTVYFPPGTYIVTSVEVSAGIRILGDGATIKKQSNQGRFVRTFDTFQRRYSGSVDSQPLIFQGLRFDGSRHEQGPYQNFELDQQHMIFLSADPALPGRLRVIVEDCVFHDGVADGISIHTNVDVKITNCAAHDVFRGGITLHGGYSKVQITNFTACGIDHDTGIDVEIAGSGSGGAGYGDTMQCHVQINGALLSGDFDVALSDDSTLLGNNIRMSKGPFSIYAVDSMVRLSNSYFVVGELSSSGNRITKPDDVTFDNCTFEVSEVGHHEADRTFAAVHVYFQIQTSTLTDQSLRFLDCDFVVHESVDLGDTVYAIKTAGAVVAERNNRIVIHGGSISEDHDFGVYMTRGGVLDARDLLLDSTTGFYFHSDPVYRLDAALRSVVFGPNTEEAEHIASDLGSTTLLHQDVLLDEGLNVLGSGGGGISTHTYLGARTILGASPPASVPGYLGDRFRLKVPAEQEVYEWVCTKSDHVAAGWASLLVIGS